MCYLARLANHHLGGGSVAGDNDINQIHASSITLSTEGEGVVSFRDIAQVGVRYESAGDVIDAELCIAGGSSVELEVSLSADRIGIEMNLVNTDSVDCRNTNVVLRIDDLVGEVCDILHIHEDSAAIGAEIDGTGPFGLGESVEVLGDTSVGEVVTCGQFAGLLTHRGHGDTLEVGISLPCGGAFLGEDTFGGTNEESSGGVFNDSAVGRNGRICQRKGLERRRTTRIVNDGYISEVRREVLEGEDKTILSVTVVNNHVADGAGKPGIVVVIDGVGMERGFGDANLSMIRDILVGKSGREIHILKMRDADKHGFMSSGVVDIDVYEASVAAHDSLAWEDASGLAGITVNGVNGAPDRLAGIVTGAPFDFTKHFGEVGSSPRKPYASDIGSRSHAGSHLSTDSQHTDLQRIAQEKALTGKLSFCEDMLEGVVTVGTAVEVGHIANFHFEGTSIAFGSGVSHGVDRTTFLVTDNDTGIVLPLRSQKDGIVFTILGTEDDAKSVDGAGDGIVEDGIVVGFPKANGADDGTANDLVGHKVLIDGPGVGIGVVKIVGIGTAETAVRASGKDSATGLRVDLLEGGSSDGAAVASPEDVGLVVEDEGTVVVPTQIVFTVVRVGNVMVEMGFDNGAGIVVSAADDGTIGADSKTVNLEIVETTVFVDKGEETIIIVVLARVDAAVGSKVIGVV